MAKDETSQRIIDAARTIFARNGWVATTTVEIARAAGVNEVTLFRHFGNKNQLFAAMVRSYIHAQTEVLSQTIEQNASLDEILTRFAEVYFKTVGSNPDYVRTMLGEMARHEEEVRTVVVDMMKPMREQFISLLDDRKRRGEIRPDVNSEVVMDAFIGGLFANIIKPCFHNLSYTKDDYIRFCVRLFVEGLKPC